MFCSVKTHNLKHLTVNSLHTQPYTSHNITWGCCYAQHAHVMPLNIPM